MKTNLECGKLKAYEAELAARFDANWGMLRGTGPGHSAEVRDLPSVHDGRGTAEWVTLRFLLHGATPEEQPALEALAALQITDPDDPFFGCSRWYGEETKPHDTNAAFFIARLLVVRWRLDKEVAGTPAGTLLHDYFRNAAAWFAKECRDPILYYPNKIISDGCLALALATILDDDALRATAVAFLERWCDYSETRGWGYGENMSLGYVNVILDAFWLAFAFLPAGSLRERLLTLQDELVGNLALHAPFQMVPAIRSYNFGGETRGAGGAYSVLGLADATPDTKPNWLSDLLLREAGEDVHQRLARACKSTRQTAGQQHAQRVFEDTTATTYIQNGLRLGTLNRFPVIPGCYQHPTWGLGWQSMPAAFLVEDLDYGFVQWETQLTDSDRRTHPAADFHNGHARPALFAEKWLPEVITSCAQDKRAALVVRSMLRLSNVAAELTDQWRIPAFSGECWLDVRQVRSPQTVETDGWLLLLYPQGAIALRPLQVLACGEETVRAPLVTVAWERDALLLRQSLYHGPAERLEQERVESGWAAVLLPGTTDAQAAAMELQGYSLEESWHADGELPRQSGQNIRRTRLTGPDTDVTIEVDPWYLPRM